MYGSRTFLQPRGGESDRREASLQTPTCRIQPILRELDARRHGVEEALFAKFPERESERPREVRPLDNMVTSHSRRP